MLNVMQSLLVTKQDHILSNQNSRTPYTNLTTIWARGWVVWVRMPRPMGLERGWLQWYAFSLSAVDCVGYTVCRMQHLSKWWFPRDRDHSLVPHARHFMWNRNPTFPPSPLTHGRITLAFLFLLLFHNIFRVSRYSR